jgi:hypothetical protein
MKQRVNSKFCFELGKTPTEMLQSVSGGKVSSTECLNGLKHLKMNVRIFGIIQEAGVLQPLEMQTQSEM